MKATLQLHGFQFLSYKKESSNNAADILSIKRLFYHLKNNKLDIKIKISFPFHHSLIILYRKSSNEIQVGVTDIIVYMAHNV